MGSEMCIRDRSYGNFPLADHLAKIDAEYLDHFEALDQDTSVPLESRWSEPKRFNTTCAPDTMNPDPARQASVAVSYLLSDIKDLKSSFAVQVCYCTFPKTSFTSSNSRSCLNS